MGGVDVDDDEPGGFPGADGDAGPGPGVPPPGESGRGRWWRARSPWRLRGCLAGWSHMGPARQLQWPSTMPATGKTGHPSGGVGEGRVVRAGVVEVDQRHGLARSPVGASRLAAEPGRIGSCRRGLVLGRVGPGVVMRRSLSQRSVLAGGVGGRWCREPVGVGEPGGLVVSGAAVGGGFEADPGGDAGGEEGEVVGVPGLGSFGARHWALERDPAAPHEGGDFFDERPVLGPAGGDGLLSGPRVPAVEVGDEGAEVCRRGRRRRCRFGRPSPTRRGGCRRRRGRRARAGWRAGRRSGVARAAVVSVMAGPPAGVAGS